jgi:hypothetical protein
LCGAILELAEMKPDMAAAAFDPFIATGVRRPDEIAATAMRTLDVQIHGVPLE